MSGRSAAVRVQLRADRGRLLLEYARQGPSGVQVIDVGRVHSALVVGLVGLAG